MSEHVRSKRDGRLLAITLARPERRNAITVAMYAALADAIEGAANDPRDPADHARRRRRGFHRRQRPCRFPGRNAGAGSDEDIPVWRLLRALARNAGPLRRRGPRQCRRHRHHHAAPLRPGAGRGGRAFHHAVRRAGPGPRGGQFAAPAAACRPPRAARYLLLGETFGPTRRCDRPRQHRPRRRDRGRAEDVVAALLAQPPEALRQTQKLLRREPIATR